MTYASANRRPNSAALLGALGIPGAVGALLVVGLAVSVVTTEPEPRLKGFTVKPIPIPPPPPPPEPAEPQPANPRTATASKVTDLPPRTDMLPVDLGKSEPVTVLPGLGDTLGTGTGEITFPQPTPSATASPFKPVGASPRNNPARWVTDRDYSPRWVREGLAGQASFRLTIDAEGRIAGCSITRSTGHPALDTATCALVSKRARFEAARDSSGRAVAGSYTGTITWQIP
jgi:protein TonB